MISANARFATVTIALVGAVLFARTRAPQVLLPPGPALASLPLQFGNWVGTDLPFSFRTLAILGPGEFLQRQYQAQENSESHVDLFVAHRSRVNRQILDSHLPTECLVGSGWSMGKAETVAFLVPGYPGFTANRYLVTRGSERQLVLFWFWAHGRAVASQNWTDFYLILDSLRVNRKDYLLVRINTPLYPGEATDEAQQRLFSFAARLNPLLDRYAPR